MFSSNTEGAEALHRFVTAGQAIPEAINNVEGADGSALRWRSDWIAMLDALDSYANELADDPDAVFTVPTNGDGDPLTYSLAGVSEVPCEIPPAIMALDPEAADGPYYPSY